MSLATQWCVRVMPVKPGAPVDSLGYATALDWTTDERDCKDYAALLSAGGRHAYVAVRDVYITPPVDWDFGQRPALPMDWTAPPGDTARAVAIQCLVLAVLIFATVVVFGALL